MDTKKNDNSKDDDNSIDAGYSADDKYLEQETGDVTFTNDKSTFSNSDHFNHDNGGANGEVEAGGDNGSQYADDFTTGNEMPDDDLIDDSINFDQSQEQSITHAEIGDDEPIDSDH